MKCISLWFNLLRDNIMRNHSLLSHCIIFNPMNQYHCNTVQYIMIKFDRCDTTLYNNIKIIIKTNNSLVNRLTYQMPVTTTDTKHLFLVKKKKKRWTIEPECKNVNKISSFSKVCPYQLKAAVSKESVLKLCRGDYQKKTSCPQPLI